MYKGTLYVYDNDGKLERTYHNEFVISGRYFALECLFPFERAGATWLDDISHSEVRYFGVGKGTTAFGVDGPQDGTTSPSGGGDIDSGGVWQGASIYDYKLGSELTHSRGTVVVNGRTNRSIEIEMTITEPTHVASTEYIHEIGIFLGSTLNTPTLDPDNGSWTTADRQQAMISRIILYEVDGSNYTPAPIVVSSGTSKTLKYVFQDI